MKPKQWSAHCCEKRINDTASHEDDPVTNLLLMSTQFVWAFLYGHFCINIPHKFCVNN